MKMTQMSILLMSVAGLVGLTLPSLGPPVGPISLHAPQPLFALNQVDPPELTPPGTPPGSAILVEDRGVRSSAPNRAPFTLSRTFARGEFAACVQAAVSGVPVETQNDVKTRWTDGSLRHVLLSFWITLEDRASAQIDFVPTACVPEALGLDRSQMLEFLGGEWDATLVAGGSFGGAGLEHTVSARELLSKWSGVENQVGVRYWMKGPIATQVIVEQRSADASFDFGWRATLPSIALSGGIGKTTTSIKTRPADSAALANWQFPLTVIIGREAIRVCSSQGEVLQVCDGGRGVSGTAPRDASDGSPIVPQQGWINATEQKHKSLHPIFTITFYPGWAGVKLETVIENTWIDRIQDQYYSARIHLGAPSSAPVWESPALLHNFGSRWRKSFWMGQRPAPLRIDHNLPYLIHSRVVPNFDTSIELRQEAIVTELRRFYASDRGEPMGTALWQPYFPATAGRMDIGILPGWYVLYLYSWNPLLQDLVADMAGVSAHVPIHLREPADSMREFEPYHRTAAAGRVVSVDARASFFAYGDLPFDRSETRSDEKATSVGPIARTGWSPDGSHQPGMAYLPYALTGDWFFLEELHFWSSYNLASQNPGGCNYCRQGSLGFIDGPPRGQAWVLRNLAHAAVMTPAEMPEYTYFHSKLQNNIAIREGWYGVASGNFYEPTPDCPADCRDTRWRIGRDIIAGKTVNPLRFVEFGNKGLIDPSLMDSTKTAAAGSPWMMNFYQATLGLIEEIGFGEVTPLRQAVAKNLIGQIVHPDYNPFLIGAYRIPTRDNAGVLFQTWASVRDALTPEARGRTRFTEYALTCEDCYYAIARGTASWMVGIETDDGLSGSDAFLWIDRNLRARTNDRTNPTWDFLPRLPPDGFRQVVMRRPSWYKSDLSSSAKRAGTRPSEPHSLRQ